MTTLHTPSEQFKNTKQPLNTDQPTKAEQHFDSEQPNVKIQKLMPGSPYDFSLKRFWQNRGSTLKSARKNFWKRPITIIFVCLFGAAGFIAAVMLMVNSPDNGVKTIAQKKNKYSILERGEKYYEEKKYLRAMLNFITINDTIAEGINIIERISECYRRICEEDKQITSLHRKYEKTLSKYRKIEDVETALYQNDFIDFAEGVDSRNNVDTVSIYQKITNELITYVVVNTSNPKAVSCSIVILRNI